MNKILKLALVLIVIFMSSKSINAQNYSQEDLLKQRIKERVKLMTDYVSYMADKSNDESTRYYYRKKALPLFIGHGYEYEENGIQKKGVVMQTTSKYNSNVKIRLVRDYFSNLVTLKYSTVKIISTQAVDIKISDLKKIDSYDGKILYQCTCQYVQKFIGCYDNNWCYKDKTTKRIVCYVEAEEVEGGLEYLIMLGDTEVESTEDL